jgi:trehalose 6-phosphate phosphatase
MKRSSRTSPNLALSTRLEKELRLFPIGALLTFDFDGTLAPIRRDPLHAALPGRFERMLVTLARSYPVAIISGRSLADLEGKFPNSPFHLVGSHGFETKLASGQIRAKPHASWKTQSRRWKRAIETAMRTDPDLRGMVIEDKVHSLSLHFRGLRHSDRAIAAARKIARSLPDAPRVVGGHFVLNFVPQGSADKGEALRTLMKELGTKRALFIGDDVTDEHVFEKRLPGVLGIRILALPAKTRAPHVLSSRIAVLPILRILLENTRRSSQT